MRARIAAAAVLAALAVLAAALPEQALAVGYGSALGQDGMTLDAVVDDVLKPVVKLLGYVLTAFGFYRYFQTREEDGPAARQSIGMLATGGVMVAFTAYDLGRGSLNGFVNGFIVPGLQVYGLTVMVLGFYDYFAHSDDGPRRQKALGSAVSGGVMAAMATAFSTVALVY